MAFGQPPSDYHQGDPFSLQIPSHREFPSSGMHGDGLGGLRLTDYRFLGLRDVIK